MARAPLTQHLPGEVCSGALPHFCILNTLYTPPSPPFQVWLAGLCVGIRISDPSRQRVGGGLPLLRDERTRVSSASDSFLYVETDKRQASLHTVLIEPSSVDTAEPGG